MDERVKICFDKDYKVRVLEPSKFAHAEELKNEGGEFVQSKFLYEIKLIWDVINKYSNVNYKGISGFREKIKGLVEILEMHAKQIDEQKLRVRTKL